MRLALLKNKLFKGRYISLNRQNSVYVADFMHTSMNASFINASGGGQNPYYKLLHKVKRTFYKRLGGLYFRARFLLGRIDIPQIEIVLTTKCTLKCESCANLMQYFESNQQFTTNLQNIQNDITTLLSNVDSIRLFSIIGGEPLLFKDLPPLVEFLANQPKITALELVTNATIPFSDTLLESLKDSSTKKPLRVAISDYSSNEALANKLHKDKIIQSLINYKINFIVRDSKAAWYDIGSIYKRNRAKEDITRNFLACKMPCLSIMCEDIEKESEAIISVCPIASSLTKLKGQGEFEGDFLRVHSLTFKEDIINFYAKSFYKACDYCPNKWEQKSKIPPAIQTKEVLKIPSL